MRRSIVGNLVLAVILIASSLLTRAAHAWVADPLTYSWRTNNTNLRDHWLQYYVDGLTGSYVSAMPIGNEWWAYSTEWPRDPKNPGVCPGTKCPGLIRFVGTSSISFRSSKEIVLPNSAINDVFEWDPGTHTYSTVLASARMFTRPTIYRVQKTTGGDFYGFIYVANSYPPKDGRVFPAMIHSKDGKTWEYWGRIKGELADMFPDGAPFWGSGRSLEVRPGSIALNTSVPAANKFFTIMDCPRCGVRLAGMYSADGKTWYFDRNPSGSIRELLPPDLALHMIGPVFPSLRRVGTAGYIASVPDGWYSTGSAVRNVALIHSCDGQTWQTLGDPTRQHPTFIGQKNDSLVYFDKGPTNDVRELHIFVTWGSGEGTSNFAEVENIVTVPKTIPCPVGTTVIK